MNHLARLTLLAYPRSFRRRFGDEYLQTAVDLRSHGSHRSARIVARLLADAFIIAPAMRWEHLMNSTRTVLPEVAATLVALVILVFAPFAAIPLVAFLGVLAIAARRHDRPIAAEASDWGRRWYVWLVVAVGLLLFGAVILFTDADGDLSTIAWATWILSWLIAAVVAVVGLGLGAARLIDDRRA